MMTEVELTHFLIRGCRSKEKFKSREKADKAIDRALLRGQLVYWYQCSFCYTYHLTSQPPDEALNKRIRDTLIEISNGVNL